MKSEKMDISKILAALAQPKETPGPLEHVCRLKMVIPYINKEKRVEERAIRVIMPDGVEKPMPLIYIPHYEMEEDALELREYLENGWAVACPVNFDNLYNGKLTDDDLVFNNAALYTLRHRAEFDRNRIILVGGSAGAYLTLMLNGLQLGLCASIANSPITNIFFNFYYYFPKANEWNLQAEEKENPQGEQDNAQDECEKTPWEEMQKLMKLPIPFLARLAGIFAPMCDNFPDKEDYQRWEAHSAIGLSDCFSSPIMINHCTSDVLVPVAQVSKRFAYAKPGESLPKEFDSGLPESFPGRLKYSLEEVLPMESTRVERIDVPENAADCNLPYDESKKFNINIFDDGPVEGYGNHSSRIDIGRRFDVPYIKAMFEKTASDNCSLTPGMLRNLLCRYMGKSITLPAHEGVDDSLYGSLAIYQKEVCEELADWVRWNGMQALQDRFMQVLDDETDEINKYKLKEAMEGVFAYISNMPVGSIAP